VKQEIKNGVGNNKIENLKINERVVNNPILDVLRAANQRADQSHCHRATEAGAVSRNGIVPRMTLRLACNTEKCFNQNGGCMKRERVICAAGSWRFVFLFGIAKHSLVVTFRLT